MARKPTSAQVAAKVETLPKLEPALFRHTATVYEAMLTEAITEDVQGDTYKVFRGYLGDAYSAAKISAQYYPAVFELLTEFNCIAVLAKGARNTPSCVVLLQHPADAAIPDERKKFRRNGRSGLTTPSEAATLSQRVDNLTKAVGGVNLADLLTLVDKLDKRLTRLERKQGK